MLNLRYNGEETDYYVNFRNINENVVEVTGENLTAKETGFIITRIGEPSAFTGDYSENKTIYREVEGGFQYSDNGSVYVEPEPEPIPEPYVPTEEELKAIFEQNKQTKIEVSKMILEEYLKVNPLISTAHGGKEGTYTVTEEKQNLLMSNYLTYQIEKQVNPKAVLTWNEAGEECEVWTEAEFLQLILEIKHYVYPLVSYQQAKEKQIRLCTTEEELAAIIIDYSEVTK